MLNVSAPQLAYDALAPSVAAVELPVTVRLGPVLEGTAELTPAELRTHSLVVHRRTAAGTALEVWDAEQRQWLPEGSSVAGDALAFLSDQDEPWQATVVAAAGEDASGQPQYTSGIGGYPSYWFRAMFATAEEAAVSGPSATVSFGSVADRNRVVLGAGEGEAPETATEARLLLRGPTLLVVGGLVVRRDGPSADVTLSNAAGAAVVLRPDGAIELRPAAGHQVTVAGDLETERVVYRPAGGGSKQTLA